MLDVSVIIDEVKNGDSTIHFYAQRTSPILTISSHSNDESVVAAFSITNPAVAEGFAVAFAKCAKLLGCSLDDTHATKS